MGKQTVVKILSDLFEYSQIDGDNKKGLGLVRSSDGKDRLVIYDQAKMRFRIMNNRNSIFIEQDWSRIKTQTNCIGLEDNTARLSFKNLLGKEFFPNKGNYWVGIDPF